MTSEPWMEFLANPKSLFVGCGSIIAIVAILASQVRRGYVSKVEADLKRDMVARGRSAHEIERILAAKSENGISWEAGIISGPHSRQGRG